jgi:dihydrolipoamide dehydrogenase
VPAVIYTDPEIAWVGLTETEASDQNKSVLIGRCSWNTLGRAHSLNCTDGLTKLICDAETGRILGVGIVGKQAGELIAEGALAIELAATVEDIVETIHPHPSLSESLKEAARQILNKS